MREEINRTLAWELLLDLAAFTLDREDLGMTTI
jgi:hypothetical protein